MSNAGDTTPLRGKQLPDGGDMCLALKLVTRVHPTARRTPLVDVDLPGRNGKTSLQGSYLPGKQTIEHLTSCVNRLSE